MRRRIREKMKKKTALLLSLSLIFGNVLPVYATANVDINSVQNTQDVINISSADELISLSKGSTVENFTLNKTYVLTNDIDLSDKDFKPVAIFSGTLDGSGYTIKGLNVSEKSTGAGLISVLGTKGSVKNLHVEGNISPEGGKTLVGGVVGTNKGVIENVSFAGYVTAYKKVGGIAGVNDESGFIINSKNHAVVDGTKIVGGICGYNKGSIVASQNLGRIAGDNESVLPDDDKMKSVPGINALNTVTDDVKQEMIGGIAGVSSGIIRDCTNSEKVGYSHIGYKVGGIVGLQTGALNNCINEASVYGRKDIGGIAGLLRPYIEISYEGDTIDSLERQTETLSKLLDAFEAEVDKNATILENNIDGIDSKKNEIEDSINERKNFHTEEADKFDAGLQEKKDDIKGITGNINSDISDIGDNVGDLRHGESYKDIINDRNTKLQNLIAGIKNINEISKRMKSDIEDKKESADNIADDFQAITHEIDDLYSKSNELLDYLDDEKSDLRQNLDNSYDTVSGKKDELEAEINKARQDLRSSRQDIKGSVDGVKNEIDNIRGTIQNGGDRLKEKIDDGKIYFDVSVNPPKEYAYGRLENSVNRAIINGDINTAGIVGRVGIDPEDGIITETDIKDNVDKRGETSLNFSNNVYALIQSNTNEGEINVKNDYAGGIVAKADYGAVISNKNFADVSSQNGSYIGGIAGYSKNLIKDSYMLGDVKGSDYIGGITGIAKDLTGNTAMSTVVSTNSGRFGSIAGDVLKDAYVSANRYVDEGVGAINDITLNSEAGIVSYEELLQDNNTPEGFKTLRVNYFVGDDIIKTVNVAYNSYVSGADIPNAPEVEGYNTYWENKELNNIKRNINIHLVEERWNKNISANTNVNGKPVLLASALFYEGTSIQVEETRVPETDKDVIKAYKYSIIPEGRYMNEGIELRVLNEDGRANAVGIRTENGIIISDTVKVGSYLSFKVDSPQGEIVLIRTESMNKYIIILSFIAATAVIISGYLYYKKKKK